ncbi:plant/F25P12-18 protein [Cucumis melo var. makuwa]|uniref:Plant/F25P12-18 protein n=1 Tax=Cucumis melo var. makuwa TaxID=1194695 RepID=A0A5A7TX45_CUCMM|nr:plant/F25P12-18 protein [Cucumis melo var. makuwa]
MSLITEEIKAKADELYYGDEMCQIKSRELLKEMDLPNGLLPMKDMEECGIVKETGFVWLKQKKSYTHKFKDIDRLVTYGTEVTAYVEKNKVKKLTGVKAKELMIWLPLCDIYVNQPPNGKITFKSTTGLSRTFPVSAFQVEEDVKVVGEKENKEKENKEKENKEKKVVNGAAAAAAIEVKEV